MLACSSGTGGAPEPLRAHHRYLQLFARVAGRQLKAERAGLELNRVALLAAGWFKTIGTDAA
jgi:hypothetical protein